MMVVLSLSMVTFLACPRSSIFTFSSLMPRSSVIAFPPVSVAMSCNMALRRSPNPGAFTAATCSVPRSLLTTRVARASLDVLCDDKQRLATLGDLLKQRGDILHGADLLFVNENVGVLEGNFHAFRIRDEVGGEVAAVELHAFHDFQLGLERLRLFHRDDAILADFLHGLGDDVADRLVVVRADGADLSDHVAGDGLGQLVEFAFAPLAGLGVDGAANHRNRFLDAALHGHGVGAGRDRLHAFAIDGLRQNGRGGGAIASDVGSLGSDFTHHLRANVLQPIFQFDFFCHGHAVLGNGRRSEFLLNHNIAAFGAESHLHGVGQNINAAENRLPRFLSVYDLFCHNQNLLSEVTDFLAGHACGMSWVAWGAVTSYWRPTPDRFLSWRRQTARREFPLPS